MIFSTIPRPFKLRGMSRKGLDDGRPGYVDYIMRLAGLKEKYIIYKKYIIKIILY